MITEQYVTFEIAQLLKEAGFREPSRGLYLYNPKEKCYKLTLCILGEYDERVDEMYEKGDYYGYGDFYLAPTQALAARWLREVHRIAIILTPMTDGWMYDLYDLKKYQYIILSKDAGIVTYEDAFEKALQEALQLIIETKNNERIP